MTVNHHSPRHFSKRTGHHHSVLREHVDVHAHRTRRDRTGISITTADEGHRHHDTACSEFARTRSLARYEELVATLIATPAETIEELVLQVAACIAGVAGGIEPQMFEQTDS